MSLTHFVKTPRISKAFDQFATKTRTPEAFKKRPLLVDDSKGPSGLAGGAFDYLTRIHIARVLRETDIPIHQSQWISEYVQVRLSPNVVDGSFYDNGDTDNLHKRLTDAHQAARSYIDGKGSIESLTLHTQYMAQSDLFVRTAMGPRADFVASNSVAQELIAMMEMFDPVKLFTPRKRVFLNPTFKLGGKVGGADADLIVDDKVIELKTTKQLSLTKRTLLQLSGYAVLHDLGGVETTRSSPMHPLTKVGVYFARHNALIELLINELFPGDGYEQFKAVFEEEMNALEKQRLRSQNEIKKQLAQRTSISDSSHP